MANSLGSSKPTVLIVLGPTASGKSGLGIELARKWNGEVISADSRQVYKGLDVGSGKVTKREMQGITHHLLDVADPKKRFSASDYKKLGDEAIEKILEKNKLPIIVGGTGFYIDTLTGSTILPEVPPNKKLREKLEKKSVEALFKTLQKKDSERAKNIDKHNKVRLIRALEIIEALGKVPTKANSSQLSAYSFIYIGLNPEREVLDKMIYKRLIARLPKMIKEGEVLHKEGLSYKRMTELGLEYKYLSLLVQKKINKQEFIDKLYRETRQYSKRQYTWFKRNKKIKWFSSASDSTIQGYLGGLIQK